MVRVVRSTKRTIKARPASSGKSSNIRRPTKKTFASGGKKKPSAFADAKRKSNITGFAGAAGFKQAKIEKKQADENRRRRMLPWRLWLKPGSEGEVILTSDQPYFMYEHQYQGSDGKPAYERCIKDTGYCPLCSKFSREGYYVMMLDSIDLRGYKNRKGEKINASEKLFPVKQSQMPKFERIYAKNGNSFRGVKLHLTRDGDKDSVIGNDIEQIGKVSEAKLAKYGKLANPLDMEASFPRLGEKELERMYGAAGSVGRSDFDKDDDDEDADEDENW